MSKKFRHANFGLIPEDMSDSRVGACEVILKAFIRNANQAQLLSNPESHKEIFSIAREYIGDDFRSWLYVNYWDGSGARKELVRKIIAWLEGKVSSRAVTSQLAVDGTRMEYITQSGRPIQTPIIYDEYDRKRNNFEISDVHFDNIKDRHFHDLIAMLGPQQVAVFLLSLNGVPHV